MVHSFANSVARSMPRPRLHTHAVIGHLQKSQRLSFRYLCYVICIATVQTEMWLYSLTHSLQYSSDCESGGSESTELTVCKRTMT